MEIKGRNGETENPLLLISHGKSVKKHVIYNPSEKRFNMLNNISELHGKKVLGSIYGWLILVEPTYDDDGDYDDGNCCLFNPITTHKIELPKLNNSRSYNQCILTKPPTELDCYILFNGIEQSFCRIGDEEYVTRTVEQQEEERENGRVGFDSLSAIGSFQGTAYGFMHPDKFVTIHFVGKTIEFRQIPMVEPWVIPHLLRTYETWLIESSQSCGGEFLMVQKIYPFAYHCYEGLDFAVFQININRITNQINCIEVKNIGNRTIFLSYNGAGYCCPSIGTKPNSIYYTNEDESNLDRDPERNLDRNLHIFDLKDRSTKSMLPSSVVAANKSITTSWVQHEIFR